MSKWARRAKQAGVGPQDLLGAELPRVKQEASTSAEDLAFAFRNEGIEIDGSPPYSEEGLCIVESLYRKHYDELTDPELIERLMSLFLGQVVVVVHGGTWAVYPGTYHVYFPIVVQLRGQARYVEPFLFCTEMAKNLHLLGAKQGRALTVFLRGLDTHATS